MYHREKIHSEAKRERLATLARNMLRRGFGVTTILTFTQLSPIDLERIQRDHLLGGY